MESKKYFTFLLAERIYYAMWNHSRTYSMVSWAKNWGEPIKYTTIANIQQIKFNINMKLLECYKQFIIYFRKYCISMWKICFPIEWVEIYGSLEKNCMKYWFFYCSYILAYVCFSNLMVYLYRLYNWFRQILVGRVESWIETIVSLHHHPKRTHMAMGKHKIHRR